MRMSINISEEQKVWLEKRSEETGATLAGVVRLLITKEMKSEKNDNDSRDSREV